MARGEEPRRRAAGLAAAAVEGVVVAQGLASPARPGGAARHQRDETGGGPDLATTSGRVPGAAQPGAAEPRTAEELAVGALGLADRHGARTSGLGQTPLAGPLP